MIWVYLICILGLTAAEYAEPEYLDQLLAEGKHEEFAKLMGIDVQLVRPENGGRSEGSLMNFASPLGDILLSPEQEEKARQGIDFSKYPESRWPNNRIPYVIASDFDPLQRAIILESIADFNSQVSNLQLVPRRRFRRLPRDYVYVFDGNGCYSYLGRIGEQQALSLQKNGCVYKTTIQHEFMHAAGYTHEQNRMDRDDYIELIPENIPAEWQSQYEKVSDDDFNLQTDYDYYSIMHYPVTAPGSGKPAFKVLKPGIDESKIGNGEAMTEADIDKINILYSDH